MYLKKWGVCVKKIPTFSRGSLEFQIFLWPHARPTFITFYYFITKFLFVGRKYYYSAETFPYGRIPWPTKEVFALVMIFKEMVKTPEISIEEEAIDASNERKGA
jgi:hypothetical protein